MISDGTAPYPSLEGGNRYTPAGLTAPIVNSVEDRLNLGNRLYAEVGTPNLAPMYRAEEQAPDWLGMSRKAYDASESWLRINQRRIWASNMAHYKSEHAPGSPALLEANKHRSSYFWPKSRTLVRAIQAAGCAAFFTSADVVVIEAEDQDDKGQCEAASFMKELVNYRLEQTVPWYQLVLGALSEASVLGTVVSHQSWDYLEETITMEVADPATGLISPVKKTTVLRDRPNIRLVPVENIRLSAAADWIDPINSSPYLIELIPMFLCDVKAKIREGVDSHTGEPGWNDVGDSVLLSAGHKEMLDTTARARMGKGRLDPKSNTATQETVDEFRIVWVHRNIVRHNNHDWLYYTAGTSVLLSEPVKLAPIIPWADGKRDYAFGKMEVETDQVFTSSPVEIISGMQKATNELKNQRYDNVRQVLNRRYLIRGGTAVDTRALVRNVPGGIISISAPGPLENHVSPLATPDVTSSSYQEEERINLAMDDLSGSTSGSTVNSNRKMNETVGGMQMMQEAGNQVREMELRTITKTWVENVIRQIVQMEAMYETNETALTVAAKKAKLLRVLPQYFNHRFSVSINVGMGAVSPTQRMQKIQGAISTVISLVPDAALAINGEEIAKEVFGAAGYDNGERFFDFAKAEQLKANPQADPQTALAKEQMDQRTQIEQAKLQIAQGKLQLDNAKLQSDIEDMQAKRALEAAKMTATLKEMEAKLNLLIAQTTTTNVTAIYEATQAAGTIVQAPEAASLTDGLLLSAGFKDHNPPPIVPQEAIQAVPVESTMPEAPNTHPNLPPQPVPPPSPGVGIRRGIETQQIERLAGGGIVEKKKKRKNIQD